MRSSKFVPGSRRIGCKSQFAVEFDLSGEDAATVPAQLLLHVPARVDESRSAGVGAEGDGPAVFDGPQAGDREEVFVTGCVAPPAVVRRDQQGSGSLAYESAVEVAVEPFVADRGSHAHAVMNECRTRFPTPSCPTVPPRSITRNLRALKIQVGVLSTPITSRPLWWIGRQAVVSMPSVELNLS